MWRAIFVVALLTLSNAPVRAEETPAKTETKSFKPVPAHDFDDADGWLNSKPIRMKDLRGKVVILHFWTFGCINCVHNLPHYKQWQQDFAKDDVVIIGIHTPETDGERNLDNLNQALKQRGITYPILIDNSATQWKKWRAGMWPTCALIDKNGMLRYYWEGELNWKEQKGEEYMRGKIKELLAEKRKAE